MLCLAMKNRLRVAVYIDGSNLFFKLRSPEIGGRNLARFDYRGLAESLAHGRQLVNVRYYVGTVRASAGDMRGQALVRDQQRLFAHLESPSQRLRIQRGYLMQSGGKYHEKGVDVRLAVDVLVGAYENLYDVAIIISSDTDLIPAIQKAIRLGRKIEYVGFSHQPSFALQRSATVTRLLIRQNLDPFFAK